MRATSAPLASPTRSLAVLLGPHTTPVPGAALPRHTSVLQVASRPAMPRRASTSARPAPSLRAAPLPPPHAWPLTCTRCIHEPLAYAPPRPCPVRVRIACLRGGEEVGVGNAAGEE